MLCSDLPLVSSQGAVEVVLHDSAGLCGGSSRAGGRPRIDERTGKRSAPAGRGWGDADSFGSSQQREAGRRAGAPPLRTLHAGSASGGAREQADGEQAGHNERAAAWARGAAIIMCRPARRGAAAGSAQLGAAAGLASAAELGCGLGWAGASRRLSRRGPWAGCAPCPWSAAAGAPGGSRWTPGGGVGVGVGVGVGWGRVGGVGGGGVECGGKQQPCFLCMDCAVGRKAPRAARALARGRAGPPPCRQQPVPQRRRRRRRQGPAPCWPPACPSGTSPACASSSSCRRAR